MIAKKYGKYYYVKFFIPIHCLYLVDILEAYKLFALKNELLLSLFMHYEVLFGLSILSIEL